MSSTLPAPRKTSRRLERLVQDPVGTTRRAWRSWTGPAASPARMRRWTIRPGRRPTLAVGFSAWKHDWLARYLPDRELCFVGRLRAQEMLAPALARAAACGRPLEVLVWGTQSTPAFEAAVAQHGLAIERVEDGFLRSTGLGGLHTQPRSLCFDRQSLYFDARASSDLEHLLATHDFAGDAVLRARARRGLERLLGSGLSKYNHAADVDVAALYGPKTARRVLVLGQVEDDASIALGADRPWTNNELVRLAAAEHPGAQILYKVHPDVLAGHRPYRSDPSEVASLCTLLREPLPLAQALQTIDYVYTITSLGGFEALLRRIPVTTVGCPFYAGWGLTDDRQAAPRRGRRLSIEDLFAAAYLLYPRYFDPATGAAASFEDVLDALQAERRAGQAPARAPSRRTPGVASWFGSWLASWSAAGSALVAARNATPPAPWSPPSPRNALSLYVP